MQAAALGQRVETLGAASSAKESKASELAARLAAAEAEALKLRTENGELQVCASGSVPLPAPMGRIV